MYAAYISKQKITCPYQDASIVPQGSTDDIENFLPLELGQMKATADRSLKLAKEVEKKFESLMLLIGELLVASVAAKSTYEEKLNEAGTMKLY